MANGRTLRSTHRNDCFSIPLQHGTGPARKEAGGQNGTTQPKGTIRAASVEFAFASFRLISRPINSPQFPPSVSCPDKFPSTTALPHAEEFAGSAQVADVTLSAPAGTEE
jgi:hypothetical protein